MQAPYRVITRWLVVGIMTIMCSNALSYADQSQTKAQYEKSIEPILNKYCMQCHDTASKKGAVSLEFDETQDKTGRFFQDHELWLRALKMLRAGLMPPKGEDQLSKAELAEIENWIKFSVFGIDPKNLDPGRVTLRRLNRTEYHNTILDLTGVDFNTGEFPPDDTGHGFDNIADVLTMSPLLLEKYIAAAKTIVAQTVPTKSYSPREQVILGQRFTGESRSFFRRSDSSLSLSYYKPSQLKRSHEIETEGQYQIILDLRASETFVDGKNDYNKCQFTLKWGDQTLLKQEFARQGNKNHHFEFETNIKPGKHELILSTEPLTPNEPQVRALNLRIISVIVRGPLAKEHWVRDRNHERYFPGVVPTDPQERRNYSRDLLRKFASKAYRRPIDNPTLDRLVNLVETTASKPGQSFETGYSQAITVILASPRFLFREEDVEPNSTDRYPLIDEYSLASRLSYFFWSTMPDEELLTLASEHKLRQNLSAQIDRMLKDQRSNEFTKNFMGQWLQSRAVDSVNVNAFAVLSKDEAVDSDAQKRRMRFRELSRKPADELTADEKKELDQVRSAFFGGFNRFRQFELTGELRRAMRQETEMLFDYILKNDRGLLELIDSNYTFLNERLAKHYGIDGVVGDRMRKVDLPPDSPRGGVLTQGTVLTITSNPDRTSPVKRGLYILDTILGTPPPPPPPDVTPLEQASASIKGRPPTLRESLKIHREDPKCASCHSRMDPLGLALENFNALGRWRDKELGQPIESGGRLLSGESFKDVKELKRVLAAERRLDYYRCLSEKLLIYSLGRGLGPQDTQTLDEIVAKLDASGGKPSTLIKGVIESPAFQRQRRRSDKPAAPKTLTAESNQND